MGSEYGVARRVIVGLLAMHRPIDLYDHTGRVAVEVDDEAFDDVLPPEA